MAFFDFTGHSIWLNLIVFVIAAICVWFAGTRLTGYLDRIVAVTGVSQAFVGMLLLGGITSLPEIATVSTASVTGNAPLATNNLLGSVAINVLLIALADAVLGRDALTSSVPSTATIIQGTLGIISLALVAIAILVGDVPLGWVGLWPILLGLYCFWAFWLASRYAERTPWKAKDERQKKKESAGESEQDVEEPLTSLVRKTVLVSVIILIAGFFLARTGDAIAEQSGLGAGLVGLVLVGFATSLPEVSSVTEAVRRKRYEMALGDIFGTNLLTIAFVLLADVLYFDGPVLNEAGKFEVVAALLGLVLTGIFCIGLLERGNRTLLRMGYDAIVALITFAGGLVLLYSISGSSG